MLLPLLWLANQYEWPYRSAGEDYKNIVFSRKDYEARLPQNVRKAVRKALKKADKQPDICDKQLRERLLKEELKTINDDLLRLYVEYMEMLYCENLRREEARRLALYDEEALLLLLM